MNWAVLSSIFALGMFKFMFSAIPGAVAKVPLYQTYIAMVSGAVFSSFVFYFLSKLVNSISHKIKERKRLERERKGIPEKVKRRFTPMNKFIVRLKRSIGIYGITFWAPFFLSIPIGTIVAYKFYSHKKRTYPLIVIGICLNGLAVVYLSYLFN